MKRDTLTADLATEQVWLTRSSAPARSILILVSRAQAASAEVRQALTSLAREHEDGARAQTAKIDALLSEVGARV